MCHIPAASATFRCAPGCADGRVLDGVDAVDDCGETKGLYEGPLNDVYADAGTAPAPTDVTECEGRLGSRVGCEGGVGVPIGRYG